MKICIINNLYKPYSRGGADKIAGKIADGLENKGHNIFVISTRPLKKKEEEKYYKKNYYIFSSFHYLNQIPKIIRFLWHLGDIFNFINLFKINQILKKEKPDLVITHNLKGISVLSCLAIKKNKIKHIHYLHDIQLIHPSGLIIYGNEKKIKNLTTNLYSAICSLFIGSPQLIISPSRWLLNLHSQKKFFKKSSKKILLNPIDLNILKNTPNKINTEKEKRYFQFLFVGEMEEQKGAVWAVKSFLSLPEEIGKKSKLIMVGKGNKKKKISRLARNNKNIKILGWQNNIKKYMNESDILLVPSLCYDNSPTVIYEAASAGLPALASNLGGIPELISEFGGALINVENKKNLAEQMAKIFKNKNKILLKDNYQERLKKIKIDNYIENILRIIEN